VQLLDGAVLAANFADLAADRDGQVTAGRIAWLGDLAVLYTLPCQEGGAVSFSHLMTSTVDASDASHTIDLSALVQDLASKTTKDFDDGTAIRLPNGGRIGEPIT